MRCLVAQISEVYCKQLHLNRYADICPMRHSPTAYVLHRIKHSVGTYTVLLECKLHCMRCSGLGLENRASCVVMQFSSCCEQSDCTSAYGLIHVT